MRHHHRSGAGPDLGDDAGGHGGPDDVMAAVVLTANPVEGLDVDRIGSADGWFQFRDRTRWRHCIEMAPNPFVPFPGGSRAMYGIEWRLPPGRRAT